MCIPAWMKQTLSSGTCEGFGCIFACSKITVKILGLSAIEKGWGLLRRQCFLCFMKVACISVRELKNRVLFLTTVVWGKNCKLVMLRFCFPCQVVCSCMQHLLVWFFVLFVMTIFVTFQLLCPLLGYAKSTPVARRQCWANDSRWSRWHFLLCCRSFHVYTKLVYVFQ